MAHVYEQNTAKLAGADLSDKQFYFVKVDGNDEFVLCSAITDRAFGVLQNNPEQGQEANVQTIGNTKIVGTVALSLDDVVAPATTGKAQVGIATQFGAGIVVTATSADEKIGVIKLINDAAAIA